MHYLVMVNLQISTRQRGYGGFHVWFIVIIAYVNQAVISSWNQPVLSNEGRVSYSQKHYEPLMGFKLTPDLHKKITCQMCIPIGNTAPSFFNL